MKTIKFSKLKKGDQFKESRFNDCILEFQFFVSNAGGYGGKKGEGHSAYVLKKEGFSVSFILIHRKDEDEVMLLEPEDLMYLSEVEDRIRQTARYVELYALAEKNSSNENLTGTYAASASYGQRSFSRGDIVRDCHDRIGIVLGVDGHSITTIGRVDYRVLVEDSGKKGVGIFRADEITKIGKMDDISQLKD